MIAQAINPATEVMLRNQLNTTVPLFDRLRNDKNPTAAQTPTALYGVPNRFVFFKNLGAWPESASEMRIRLLEYTSELAAVKTAVNKTALRIDGRIGTPASWVTMTRGDAEAS